MITGGYVSNYYEPIHHPLRYDLFIINTVHPPKPVPYTPGVGDVHQGIPLHIALQDRVNNSLRIGIDHKYLTVHLRYLAGMVVLLHPVVGCHFLCRISRYMVDVDRKSRTKNKKVYLLVFSAKTLENFHNLKHQH